MNLPRRIRTVMNKGRLCRRACTRGIAGALLGMLLSLSAMAQVSLVRDGEARAVVVTADTPTPTARYAAEELVGHIEKATGVALDIVTESDGLNNVHTRVYIGDTEAGRHLGLDPDHLPRETFVLRSVGNDLFIAGREDDGDPFAESVTCDPQGYVASWAG